MSSKLKYWYLHKHKLFKNLSYEEIDGLCILKRFNKSKKNEIIQLPYSEKERVYFLKKGTIKLISICEQGQETLINVLQKGDLFGDLNLERSEEVSNFFKVVSEEAIICTFLKERLENLTLKKPDFALKYIKFIGFRYKSIQNNYRNLLFKDAKSRLVLLLNMLIEKEEITSSSYTLPNYLTQKDYAQLICASRQTIISLFKELEEEGFLNYSQKEISIPDISKINKFIENVK
ncbi:Crp/Fnr family transcriptional regulator [uncultured Tenacibaculum sp.]|uniref:Crp/Fnr family transcriptional regulator n=1 Tax=uncultured Tenacibaculum sp. TaxID=174713 RepID=UPI00263480C8|nr:Crp/Fnr family transcriptional regulator [uncultured Tenacibaculum sp.]